MTYSHWASNDFCLYGTLEKDDPGTMPLIIYRVIFDCFFERVQTLSYGQLVDELVSLPCLTMSTKSSKGSHAHFENTL